jgi:hypothetical protein
MTAHLTVCHECHLPIDMREVGTARIGAHSRDFCSMGCADAWESNPDNTDAVRRSHQRAADAGWPHDPQKL